MRIKAIVTAGAAALVLLTGCASGGLDPASGGAGVAADESGYSQSAVEDAAARDSAGGDSAGGDGAAGDTDVAPSQDYMVREASLGLKVDAILDAAVQVRQIASAAGGSVTSESFGDEYYGPASTGIDRYGSLTISVPSASLDEVMAQLSELGEVRTRSSNAYSVQDEYVDVEARIATLTASIDRMRDLMAQTDDIDQIVKLETALSSRQADLDALQARLNALQSSIAMSPVNVMLTTTNDLGEPQGGFVDAIKSSWSALTQSARALLIVAGALLPWLVVGGLVGAVVWWLVKRLRGHRAAKAAAAAPPRPTQPAPAAASTSSTPPQADPTKAPPIKDA